MKSAAQISYFRQICCLGLGGQIIMPELLRAMHDFIPSSFNMFLWVDESHQLSNLYSENSEAYDAQPLHLNPFLRAKEVPSPKTPSSESIRELTLSDHCDLATQPLNVAHCVKASIQENGRGVGSILLNRRAGEKPFSEADRIRLRSLMPYFAHGLRGTRDVRVG